MSVTPDRSYGRTLIWIIAIILFTCVLVGGGCLTEYMVLPESKVPSWILVLGFFLLSLPWVFWLLTFLYQIFSRCCGCRIGFDVEREGLKVGGGDRGSGGGATATVDDPNVKPNANGIDRTLSVLSVASHESQMPLAKSMVS
ncbi:hypothetical protein LR48_Vigan04g128900 [Vigna angularis]|uniref:Uncharacterized protein n=2 Tax=Phaseolus angularis TaxID=3914 RepID=A0A0L9UEF8_PHAAN|nr:uncharacterized protein LOC108330372 [Vigna angularis]KOM41091.1 hypothetical protein LR48_Vigan04g128900 [Vigna angularis]BAT79183.1 hypothetical protein VIGAN_02201400 [Vigna angularis var. angularis]